VHFVQQGTAEVKWLCDLENGRILIRIAQIPAKIKLQTTCPKSETMQSAQKHAISHFTKRKKLVKTEVTASAIF